MPAIEIDEKGTKLYYFDSGIPMLTDPDTPYTTLICVHGYIFNANIFRKLLPIAPSTHMRLIVLNRRGYHGSTPLPESQTNVDLATSRTDFYKTFLQSRAEEVAKFLVKLIEIENIPVKVESPGRASGGIALLGWSLGNVFTMSLLALANTFDPAIQSRLQPYLRKLIVLDAPYHAWGYPPEKDVYDPYYDPTIPDAQREQIFAGWVSSYYTHSSEPLDPKASLMQGLEQKHPNAKPNTMSRFTPADFSTIIEQTTNAHGDHFVLLDQHRPVHRENLYKVLFGNRNDPNAVKAFPDVNISYIWCTEAHWHPILGMRLVKADVESPPTGLHLQRKIKFVALEGGNHYPHYDDPLKSMAAFALAMEF